MSAINTVRQKRASGSFNRFSYPNQDLAHFTSLFFTNPQRGKVFRTNNRLETSVTDIPDSAIILPIPSNLQEQFQVNYEGVEIGEVIGGVAQATAEVLNGKSISDVSSSIETDSLGKRIGQETLKAIGGGGAVSAAQKFVGEVFNPHLTTVFKGVGLRQHTFNWRVSPRSKSESFAIKAIIDKIRNNMLPELSTDRLRLSYPAECFIQFHGDPYGIMPMFRSVCTGLNVNHAAAGTPTFFAETGLPSEFELQLSFQEVEIVTRGDVSSTGALNDTGFNSGGTEFKDEFGGNNQI
jgi:hypothetical protein